MKRIGLAGTRAAVAAAALTMIVSGCAAPRKAAVPPAAVPAMDAASYFRRGVGDFQARRYDDAIANPLEAVREHGRPGPSSS